MDSKKEKKRSPLALVIIAPATFWLALIYWTSIQDMAFLKSLSTQLNLFYQAWQFVFKLQVHGKSQRIR